MKVSAIIGGMSLGLLTFVSTATWAGPEAVSIVQDPTAVGTPVGKRGPKTLKFTLEAQEVLGILDAAAKSTYTYWTFNGKVPGPMLRARVGDTIEITLKNAKSSAMITTLTCTRYGVRVVAPPIKCCSGEEVLCVQGAQCGSVCLPLRHASDSQHISAVCMAGLIEPEAAAQG